MKVMVTGSSGHLGDALTRTLRDQGHDAVGIDILEGACCRASIGSTTTRAPVRCSAGGHSTIFGL